MEKQLHEQLRPYQINGINAIFQKWQEGKRSILFQMPTGTGKTVLFSEIAKKGHDKNRRILIIVHRKELVNQIVNKLASKNVSAGIIMSGVKAEPHKIVQVASIQTLSKREEVPPDLIIIDECHHAKAESYSKLWELYPNAKVLGVTATPIRMSGEGFEDIFEALIVTDSIQKFVESGYLVSVKHFVCSNPNLSGVKQSKGDYVTKMLSNVMRDNTVMKDLVDSYCEKCNGKTMIVFAVDVEHSKEIAMRYNQIGISAAHIDSTTPAAEREQILFDFKNKIIKVVCNVEIITEGFDFPQCEVVQLARPTKSLALYLQMAGRVMRPAENKTEGIILDNANLWLEHGLTSFDRIWSLKGVKKGDKTKENENIVVLNEENIITRVERTKLNELKGLSLMELTNETIRLLIFEDQLKYSRSKGHNLLACYNKYLKYLSEKQFKFSEAEFEYIQWRLNILNSKMEKDKQFKRNYWYYQAKDYGFKLPKYEKR